MPDYFNDYFNSALIIGGFVGVGAWLSVAIWQILNLYTLIQGYRYHQLLQIDGLHRSQSQLSREHIINTLRSKARSILIGVNTVIVHAHVVLHSGRIRRINSSEVQNNNGSTSTLGHSARHGDVGAVLSFSLQADMMAIIDVYIGVSKDAITGLFNPKNSKKVSTDKVNTRATDPNPESPASVIEQDVSDSNSADSGGDERDNTQKNLELPSSSSVEPSVNNAEPIAASSSSSNLSSLVYIDESPSLFAQHEFLHRLPQRRVPSGDHESLSFTLTGSIISMLSNLDRSHHYPIVIHARPSPPGFINHSREEKQNTNASPTPVSPLKPASSSQWLDIERKNSLSSKLVGELTIVDVSASSTVDNLSSDQNDPSHSRSPFQTLLSQFGGNSATSSPSPTPMQVAPSPTDCISALKFVQQWLLTSQPNIIEAGDVFGAEEQSCIICLTEDKDIILLPCRHFCVCHACFKNVNRCPVCRSPIVSHVRFFNEHQRNRLLASKSKMRKVRKTPTPNPSNGANRNPSNGLRSLFSNGVGEVRPNNVVSRDLNYNNNNNVRNAPTSTLPSIELTRMPVTTSGSPRDVQNSQDHH